MDLLHWMALPGVQLGSLLAEGWQAYRENSPWAEVPALEPSFRILGEAALDQSFTLGVNLLTGVPHPGTLRRRQRELAETLALFEAHGWLANPRGYHVDPPPVHDAKLRPDRHRVGLRPMEFQHLSFESQFEPQRGSPGRERWLEFDANRSAHAYVMEHQGPPRPWLVCVHGFGMGTPTSNFQAFGVRWLHEELGLNLILPCLPLHGPRSSGRISGAELLAPDYVTMIHCFAQAVWDVRRCIDWVRRRDAVEVGLYGISLGGYNVSLVCALEADLACVIAGIPAVDFPNVARDNEPWILRAYETDSELQMNWALVRAATHVVSPLAFEPQLPVDRRFIFAGVADRVARPDQARALWRHWGRPAIHWDQSGHIGGMFRTGVRGFIEDALESSGLASR
jgi:hypothetical protein